jgi:hypothetical protein
VTRKRWPLPAAAASAVVAGLLAVLPAQPASAAVGCTYTACEGHLATAEGCDADAYPIASALVNDPAVPVPPQLDLWYSPACRAVWGEYVTTDTSQFQHIYLTVQAQYGGVSTTPVDLTVDGQDGDYRTTMISWNNSIRFCGGLGTSSCTGWR